MKLTHLSMEGLLFKRPLSIDDTQVKHLIALFRQCTALKGLELWSDLSVPFNNYKLVPYLPSLEYCRIINFCKHSIATQDILTGCKKLRCYNFTSYTNYVASSLSSVRSHLKSACYSNLQQLCISSRHTCLHDIFMDTVSAHGGLVHVALFVQSVSGKGITTLIKNSPNLLSFCLRGCKEHNESYCSSLNSSLHKRFADRKLFTSGLFSFVQRVHDYYMYSDRSSHSDCTFFEHDQWLQNTDLLSLCTPNHFCDLQYNTRF